jgi:hypothetical protein
VQAPLDFSIFYMAGHSLNIGERILCAVAAAGAFFMATRPGPFYWGALGSTWRRMPTPLARVIGILVGCGFLAFALFAGPKQFK